MVKQSLVEPSFHTRYVNYQKLFRLQRQCQEKKKKSDAFSLTLFLKGKKMGACIFFPSNIQSVHSHLLCSTIPIRRRVFNVKVH